MMSRYFSVLGLSILAAACGGGGGGGSGHTELPITNQAPNIHITSPEANQVFTSDEDISFVATASDSDGSIASVAFYLGDNLQATDLDSPYSVSLEGLSVGAHVLTAVATDNDGATTTSSAISIQVNTVPNVAPTVSLTAPSGNTEYTEGESLTVSATANDSDGNITQVEFFLGSKSLGTDASSPFSVSHNNLVLGAYSITAIATDNDGATTTSNAISIQVNKPNSIEPEQAPSALYFYNQIPYQYLELHWQDNSNKETGFRVEQRFEDQTAWVKLATLTANTSSWNTNSYDRSGPTAELRVVALFGEQEVASDPIRVVGQSDTLEVFSEVAGIRSPKDHTMTSVTSGELITFSELQDQTPADPSQGKATQVSTFFSIQVKKAGTDDTFLDSPTYETRPQLRNYKAQNDPAHSGGHKPYGYSNYGPHASQTGRTLHQKHWTNFDSSDNVTVQINLLETASLSGPINIADVEIHPAPLSMKQIDTTTLEVELPGAPNYARHYRVALNRDAWDAEVPNRDGTIIESPLYLFVNPMHLAPASAPAGEIKEFDQGQLVVIGSGIHLPNSTYQHFGSGANDTMVELYAPADAYLHYGFLVKDPTADLKIWGRAIYSDEMFVVYPDTDDYLGSDESRTPWARTRAIANNPWGIDDAWWSSHFHVNGNPENKVVFDGFTNIGARMGTAVTSATVDIKNHKDVGYGGGTYQSGNGENVYYLGNMMSNDDDVTYIHETYKMEHNTTFNEHNGPSFQFGWGVNTQAAGGKIYHHTVLSSNRRDETGYGKNHGVFNSRLQLGNLEQHIGGHFEDFDFWGKEVILFNLQIWQDRQDETNTNQTSLLSDKVFKDFEINELPYLQNQIKGTEDTNTGNVGYIRFLHFDNVNFEGQALASLDDRNLFSYNEYALVHTFTFFSLPPAVAQPPAGTAPLGKQITIKALSNDTFVQADSSLPESLSPLTANDAAGAQTFTVVDAGNGYIALNAENNFYVKADSKRYGYIHTLPDTIRGDDETQEITEEAKFIWVDNNNGSFSLYSKSMALYIRVEAGSGPEMPLYAAHDVVDEHASFEYFEE
ncbi:Ig-like domain-containing protein [Echinimonas agarilytica]|uniref:Ig-like domain-containing protein n=1 Tax=Echinimonas agarilytica TaxID=1215918 RepID=A0AA41W3P8_9GAMM|nr:Ig-like domain-containing protein [Echinimonas agarilytica]MCM2678104.1 Ig-like domain-containing protein [Echinimonas agarilytica]